MILLDANTIVHYIKGLPEVVKEMQRHSKGDLAVPCVVVYELERGTLRGGGKHRREAVGAVVADL